MITAYVGDMPGSIHTLLRADEARTYRELKRVSTVALKPRQRTEEEEEEE